MPKKLLIFLIIFVLPFNITGEELRFIDGITINNINVSGLTRVEGYHLIYPLIIDSTLLHDETEGQLLNLIKMFKQKFEAKFTGI